MRVIALWALVAIGCSDTDPIAEKRGLEHRRERAKAIHQRAVSSVPCPDQKCRPLPDGLHGVALGMSPEAAARTLGELEPVTRTAIACAAGVAAYDVATEIGGEAATCSLDFYFDRLIAIACALDGARAIAEHKAIGWALYQTLARQYGRATELDDELMSGGRLEASWSGGGRTLSLRLELLGDRSVIRLANRSGRRDRLRCAASHAEVYAPERMAAKARAFLRDLTGPLEEAP